MHLYIKKPNVEQCTAMMFCSVFGFNLIMFTFNNILRLAIGNTYYMDSIFVFICYAFILIHSLPRLLKTMKLKHWGFLILMIALPVITCTNVEVTKKILSEIIPYCLFAFMFGTGIRDYKLTWKYLYRFSWIGLLMAFLDAFVLKLFTETSHMLGYAALFPACVLSIEFLNSSKRKVFNAVGVMLSCILVVQADTAGALAAVALTIIVSLCYLMKKMRKWAFFIMVTLLAAISYIVNNVNSIAGLLINRLGGLNINIGLLEEIAGTGIKTDRFRNSIYEYCFRYAKEHWFWGCGVGTDRYLITQNTLVHDQSMVSNYPHNVFIEFMIQYGMIIGIVLSIILVCFLLKYLILEKDVEAQKIATLVLGMGFFPLLYSSSYIESAFFYIMIAFVWKRRNLMKSFLYKE